MKTIAIYAAAIVAFAFIAGASKFAAKYQDAAACARATVTIDQIVLLPADELNRLSELEDLACR